MTLFLILAKFSMLLQNSLILENVIVKLLHNARRGLNALEISENVAQTWKTYSRRGIYKELERLEKEGIIMKSRGYYTLRLAWLVSLHSEVEQLLYAGSDPKLLSNFLPTKGNDILVYCSDLVRWDQIWTQLMLTLHNVYPKLPMFIWTPRHWFSLTHPEIDDTFVRANEVAKNIRYLIVGGRGALDRKDQKHIARKSTGYSFRPGPFEDDRTHSYWVVGDYLGIATLSKRTSSRIDNIYQSTKKVSDLPKNIRQLLLAEDCEGTVRLMLNPIKADKIRQKFLKFFNLKIDKQGHLEKVLRGEL